MHKENFTQMPIRLIIMNTRKEAHSKDMTTDRILPIIQNTYRQYRNIYWQFGYFHWSNAENKPIYDLHVGAHVRQSRLHLPLELFLHLVIMNERFIVGPSSPYQLFESGVADSLMTVPRTRKQKYLHKKID